MCTRPWKKQRAKERRQSWLKTVKYIIGKRVHECKWTVLPSDQNSRTEFHNLPPELKIEKYRLFGCTENGIACHGIPVTQTDQIINLAQMHVTWTESFDHWTNGQTLVLILSVLFLLTSCIMQSEDKYLRNLSSFGCRRNSPKGCHIPSIFGSYLELS